MDCEAIGKVFEKDIPDSESPDSQSRGTGWRMGHKRLALSLRRKFHRHVVLLRQSGSTEKQLVDWFSDILDQLPQAELLVMALFYKEELNLEEIAEVMNRNVYEIYRLYSSAIIKLCSKLRSANAVDPCDEQYQP